MIDTRTAPIAPETRTLDVPGATLTYDIRRNDHGLRPALLLIGSPMGAAGFGTLSGFFTDRTVITYDPRGAERSPRTDGKDETTVEEQADDLHRLIDATGEEQVDLFASSGGAVNALALVAAHPEQVRTLLAHEPPLASILPDRDEALRVTQAVRDTYMQKGSGAGMAHFIAVVSHQGEFPTGFADQPAPDPAMFGLPTEDDGARDDPLLGRNMISTTAYEPDFDALLAASTRIVMAGGVESEGTMARRGGEAVAERLGLPFTLFPSGHGGFMGGEYGQPPGEPAAFAARLREILAGDA